jgi:hypothetical protein
MKSRRCYRALQVSFSILVILGEKKTSGQSDGVLRRACWLHKRLVKEINELRFVPVYLLESFFF